MKILESIGIFFLAKIAFTWRITSVGTKPVVPSVYAFWHDQMLPGWFALKDDSTVAIVSKSKDGSILTKILESWGIPTIRGSSSQDGKVVLQEAISVLHNGCSVIITPDGPRGPRHSMKAGAVISAYRSKSSLCLMRIQIHSSYTFQKSWDKFIVPLPWSRISIEYIPISIEYDNSSEGYIDSLIAYCEKTLLGE